MSKVDRNPSPVGSVIMFYIHLFIFAVRIINVGIIFPTEEAVIQKFSGSGHRSRRWQGGPVLASQAWVLCSTSCPLTWQALQEGVGLAFGFAPASGFGLQAFPSKACLSSSDPESSLPPQSLWLRTSTAWGFQARRASK